MSNCDKCEAHEYLEDSVKEMKNVDVRIAETLTSVRIIIATLTENLQETKRTNDRLEELLKETRKEVQEVKEEADENWTAFNIFKTRIYAYGSAAVVAGSGLGWVGDRILKYFTT